MPCGGLPVDFVKAVAGHIVTELLKIAALAYLPLGVDAKRAPAEKQRRQILPLRQQIGIHAQLTLHRHGAANIPKAEARGRFEVAPAEVKIPAAPRPTGPLQAGVFRFGGQCDHHVVLSRGNCRRQRQADAQAPGLTGWIPHGHFNDAVALL